MRDWIRRWIAGPPPDVADLEARYEELVDGFIALEESSASQYELEKLRDAEVAELRSEVADLRARVDQLADIVRVNVDTMTRMLEPLKTLAEQAAEGEAWRDGAGRLDDDPEDDDR